MESFSRRASLRAQLHERYEVEDDWANWPVIHSKVACEILLGQLSEDMPLSEGPLGKNFGYATVEQKRHYFERRSFLRDRQRVCKTWLNSIIERMPTPNNKAILCQHILDIIAVQLQGLDLWLQTLPEDDRIELTQPSKYGRTEDPLERLSASQKLALMEHYHRRYRENRELFIEPKVIEALKYEHDLPSLAEINAVIAGKSLGADDNLMKTGAMI